MRPTCSSVDDVARDVESTVSEVIVSSPDDPLRVVVEDIEGLFVSSLPVV